MKNRKQINPHFAGDKMDAFYRVLEFPLLWFREHSWQWLTNLSLQHRRLPLVTRSSDCDVTVAFHHRKLAKAEPESFKSAAVIFWLVPLKRVVNFWALVLPLSGDESGNYSEHILCLIAQIKTAGIHSVFWSTEDYEEAAFVF